MSFFISKYFLKIVGDIYPTQKEFHLYDYLNLKDMKKRSIEKIIIGSLMEYLLF